MTAKTSIALAKTEPAPLRQAQHDVEPASFEEMYRLSKILVASRMLPRHLSTPEACFAVLKTGRELGLTAMQSTRSLYFIEGKAVLSADLMVALVKRHEDCEYFRLVEATNEKVTCETKRRGEEPTSMTWTIADAQRAKLTGKDNWTKFPKAMLRARVSSDLCRAVYPDALMGVYDPDELQREPPQRVEVEHVVVPDPQPVAHDDDGVVQDAPTEDDAAGDLALQFNARILEATTTAELMDIKAEVKRAGLSEEYTAPLSEMFLRRKKEIAAAEKATREPGQEG